MTMSKPDQQTASMCFALYFMANSIHFSCRDKVLALSYEIDILNTLVRIAGTEVPFITREKSKKLLLKREAMEAISAFSEENTTGDYPSARAALQRGVTRLACLLLGDPMSALLFRTHQKYSEYITGQPDQLSPVETVHMQSASSEFRSQALERGLLAD